MFLRKLIKENQKLISASIKLYSKFGPNTYVLDLDAIIKNTKGIVQEAKKYNIELYQMTKQFGRNPLVARAVARAGIKKIVSVDPWEASIMIDNNLKLGNVGHLVQTPITFLEKIIASKPDVMTVFSYAKAQQINTFAKKLKLKQNLIIKIIDDKDVIYPGQEGGIKLNELANVIGKIQKLNNVEVIGLTSFPCFLYKRGKISPTPNIKTLHKAIRIVKKCGVKVSHINTPSSNFKSSIKLIHKYKGTHGEPGHGLIGTTPWHIKNKGEKPAMLYISEVSHVFENKGYFFGGGHYRRSKMKEILLCKGKKKILQKTNMINLEVIDYYLNFNIKKTNPIPGDIVIACFRTQVFVTRSNVAVVSGISKGQPKLLGVYDSLGRKLDEK